MPWDHDRKARGRSRLPYLAEEGLWIVYPGYLQPFIKRRLLRRGHMARKEGKEGFIFFAPVPEVPLLVPVMHPLAKAAERLTATGSSGRPLIAAPLAAEPAP